MFNGIAEGTLRVISKIETESSVRVELERPRICSDLKIGGSIAINGVYLTVTKLTRDMFSADLMPETINKTTLESLKAGDQVNFERYITLGYRIEGHMIKGHVDETGIIKEIKEEGNFKIFKINISERTARYLIPKGSIGIDGMSITIIDIGQEYFAVGLIPYTLQYTIANKCQLNSEVNLKVEDMAKYVWNYMQSRNFIRD